MKKPSLGKKSPTPASAVKRRQVAFKKAVEKHDLTYATLAERAGLPNANAISNFLNGRSKSMSIDNYERFVAAMPGMTMDELVGLEGALPTDMVHCSQIIAVRATAVAGDFRSSFDMPLTSQFEAPVPIERATLVQGAFGVTIGKRGAELMYPQKSILVCVPLRTYQGILTTKRRVILQRIVEDKVEVTVRELEVRDGNALLWPRSTDPDHQAAIRAPWPNSGQMWRKGSDRYSVVAIVVGSYCPEE